MKRRVALAALVALGAGLLAACSASVGAPVPGAPAHHRERGFANPVAAPEPLPSSWERLSFFVARVWSSTFSPRSVDLPVVPNDGRALRAPAAPTVTWVGHATLLIQLDGVNILTDPQWSGRASPVSFGGPKRVAPAGLRFEDLPPIHLVVISHDHSDHLDRATVARLAAFHHPRFLVPLGLKAWFADLGIHDVEELDWWDSRVLRGLTLTCVPARHFSGRTPWDRNRRLWGGWTITGSKRLYFAGDTAYWDAMREIGRRLGPFDLAAIPIGAYQPPKIMKPGHTTPEEALQLFDDVGGHVFVPIHWGTFDLADEPLAEPPVRLTAEAQRRGLTPERVWVLKHGETRRW
ncbi:MAG: MBL fold metallo-hydrolase [Candidatus Rokubacteria bacterium]|nr:MBL fold metallo-hydrolase [Candidatus Rokubacteria bacterium]